MISQLSFYVGITASVLIVAIIFGIVAIRLKNKNGLKPKIICTAIMIVGCMPSIYSLAKSTKVAIIEDENGRYSQNVVLYEVEYTLNNWQVLRGAPLQDKKLQLIINNSMKDAQIIPAYYAAGGSGALLGGVLLPAYSADTTNAVNVYMFNSGSEQKMGKSKFERNVLVYFMSD